MIYPMVLICNENADLKLDEKRNGDTCAKGLLLELHS